MTSNARRPWPRLFCSLGLFVLGSPPRIATINWCRCEAQLTSLCATRSARTIRPRYPVQTPENPAARPADARRGQQSAQVHGAPYARKHLAVPRAGSIHQHAPARVRIMLQRDQGLGSLLPQRGEGGRLLSNQDLNGNFDSVAIAPTSRQAWGAHRGNLGLVGSGSG